MVGSGLPDTAHVSFTGEMVLGLTTTSSKPSVTFSGPAVQREQEVYYTLTTITAVQPVLS